MHSGKDAVCNIIKHRYKNAPAGAFLRIGFGDAVKEELAAKLGQSVEYIEEHKVALRSLLQAYATDYTRNLINPDYWVSKMVVSLHKKLVPVTQIVVIPDVRFHNELNLIRSLRGVLWKVERSTGDVFSYPHGERKHTSEMSLNDYKLWDEIILNDGTLDDLKLRVISALKSAREQFNNNLEQGR